MKNWKIFYASSLNFTYYVENLITFTDSLQSKRFFVPTEKNKVSIRSRLRIRFLRSFWVKKLTVTLVVLEKSYTHKTYTNMQADSKHRIYFLFTYTTDISFYHQNETMASILHHIFNRIHRQVLLLPFLKCAIYMHDNS